MSVLLQCPHCNDYLQVMNSGVAIGCACAGAQQAMIDERARRATWAAAQESPTVRKRTSDRKPR